MSVIKYKVVERVLRGITRYFPQVVHNETVQTDEFLKNVCGLGSTLTLGDLKAAVEMIDQGLRAELKRGNRVELPWGTFGLAARGEVKGADGVFRKGQNEFIARILPASNINKELAKARTEKVASKPPNPTLKKLTDTNTGLENQVLTPGGIAVIKGRDLRFTPGEREQGLFLTDKTGAEIRVEFYGEISPGKASFVVPEIPAGVYRLALCTKDRATGDIVRKGFKYSLGIVQRAGKE